MKILITGAAGQLGKELSIYLNSQQKLEVFAFGKENLNIINFSLVDDLVQKIRPDVIIHSAAYTKVDQAEIDKDTAYEVNAYGTRNICVAAEKVSAKLIYISTDYVFDGTSSIAYNEFDRTNPINVYGKSKKAGEDIVQSLVSRYFIVRTSWVYGFYGNNFVNTMLNLAKEKDEIKVVNDQHGAPTYTLDLARFIYTLLKTELYGIYHATNSGYCSWFEFANTIFSITNTNTKILPCSTEDFPRPASRPKYSVLDHMSIRLNNFEDLRHWKDALKDYLKIKK
ncbi:dTDP-4-dehydrorhamnose reductase [Paenibacillus hamazuiensis]|uniref:dTDP-4-dehydrorhamnose reductase n=1 Tax=Paenibacillus hamazuiensis TaxID=2936508 RepID=UPI00200DF9D3|nr:dTDP-4-dehydrorhamnose reductase [Paenibacillus hamazuiensis]